MDLIDCDHDIRPIFEGTAAKADHRPVNLLVVLDPSHRVRVFEIGDDVRRMLEALDLRAMTEAEMQRLSIPYNFEVIEHFSDLGATVKTR